MRIAGLVQDSIVDGPGLRFVVFVQGCPHHCLGCHNPGSHDPEGGKEMAVRDIINQMMSNPLTDGLTLSGGEPFEQAEDCFELANFAKWYGLNVWCYTGYTFEHLRDYGTPAQKALLRNVDVLVDGPYKQEERRLSLPWRGSTNQRIIDAQASLGYGMVIEWRADN